jgi:hypothetical protein
MCCYKQILAAGESECLGGGVNYSLLPTDTLWRGRIKCPHIIPAVPVAFVEWSRRID